MERDFWEELEAWKETYLSPYCLNQCKKTCCNLEGKIITLREDELARLITQEAPVELFVPNKQKDDYKFPYFCPRYDQKTRKCQIRDQRPRACKNYPFDLRFSDIPGLSYITLNHNCPFSRTKKAKKIKEIVEPLGWKFCL